MWPWSRTLDLSHLPDLGQNFVKQVGSYLMPRAFDLSAPDLRSKILTDAATPAFQTPREPMPVPHRATARPWTVATREDRAFFRICNAFVLAVHARRENVEMQPAYEESGPLAETERCSFVRSLGMGFVWGVRKTTKGKA